MCRLLGLIGQISFWQKVLLSFQELAETGQIPPIPNIPPGHKDGWGMACSSMNESEMKLIGKYQGSAMESPIYRKNVQSYSKQPNIFICHLRKASPGIPLSLSNSQPFFYKGWAFIHNGTVYDAHKFTYNREMERTSDNSDSEYLFYHLMTNIFLKSTSTTVKESLIRSISKISLKFSSVNNMISDGRNLYAIRFSKEHEEYYNLFYCELETGVIISSEPIQLQELRDKKWYEMPNRSIFSISSDPLKTELNSF
jgi:predicted glutamine amidotransferase